VVLLEVLAAAAILATAVVVLLRLQEAAVARDELAARLAAASRAAERLIAEAELENPIGEGTRRGDVATIPGGAYVRVVEREADVGSFRLYRVRASVTYAAGGRPRAFEVEKLLFRIHAQQTAQ